MTVIVRAVLVAALIVGSGGAVVASPAVLMADTAVREGPGEEFKHLWDLVAGTHVDVRECKVTQWCFIVRRDKQGWVRLEGLDLYPGVASESDGDTASSGSSGGGSSAGGSSKRGLPGSSGGKFEKDESADMALKTPGSSSSSGSGSSSSSGEMAATEAALGGASNSGPSSLSPPCTRCAP